MRYTNLFFDCDGTILDFDRGERNAFLLLAKTLRFDGEATYPLYHQVNIACWKELEQGRIRMDALGRERFSRFLPLVGITASPCQVEGLFLTFLSRQGIVYPGVKETLIALKEQGHKLYIASNGFKRIQEGRFAASGMTPYFDGIFISEEMGWPKPDKRFFDKMLTLSGITDRHACAIIGDSLTSDIQGGINAGIHTIWYNPRGEEEKGNKAEHTITKLSHLLSL